MPPCSAPLAASHCCDCPPLRAAPAPGLVHVLLQRACADRQACGKPQLLRARRRGQLRDASAMSSSEAPDMCRCIDAGPAGTLVPACVKPQLLAQKATCHHKQHRPHMPHAPTTHQCDAGPRCAVHLSNRPRLRQRRLRGGPHHTGHLGAGQGGAQKVAAPGCCALALMNALAFAKQRTLRHMHLGGSGPALMMPGARQRTLRHMLVDSRQVCRHARRQATGGQVARRQAGRLAGGRARHQAHAHAALALSQKACACAPA
jgi:hypothetical protein